MGSEWKSLQLGDICELRAGSVFPPALQGKLTGTYPFVKVSDMNLPANALYIQVANNWINDTEMVKLKAKPFPVGTTIFAKIGEALKANRLRFLIQPTILDNNMMGAIPTENEVDPRFFFYSLSQFDFGEIADGTALPYLTVNGLSKLPVMLPPLSDQHSIAHILGTLDDKIELNRRMNETLEAMARALFKSWFVDFDPVRAKAEGRDTGLPPEISDLFPDEFEDSELGEIPKGWNIGSIASFASVSSGKRPDLRFPTSSPNATVPLWGGNGPMAFVSEPLINEPVLLTGRVGTLGSIFRINSPCWPSDNTLILRVINPNDYEYLFLQLQQIDFTSLNRGSTQPLLTQTDLKAQRLIQPSPDILDSFSCIVRAFYKKIDYSERNSKTIASLRETLLPKLISGEIRVGEAEKYLEVVET